MDANERELIELLSKLNPYDLRLVYETVRGYAQDQEPVAEHPPKDQRTTE